MKLWVSIDKKEFEKEPPIFNKLNSFVQQLGDNELKIMFIKMVLNCFIN